MRALLACLLMLASCARLSGPQGVHYVLGEPYQAGGVWRYPQENFTYADTGLATVMPAGGTTADGEPNDPTALIAAHRTLQLPAIARVTNLDNGRQITVRINDRGPADPARLIALSRRAVELLAPANPNAFRVRVEEVEADSRSLAADLRAPPGSAPAGVKVAAAPVGSVGEQSLAPPPGAVQVSRAPAPARPVPIAAAAATRAAIPLRLPETVRLVSPHPGPLAVELGAFGRLEYAEVLRRRVAQLRPQVTTDYYAPRDAAYLVRLGPFTTVAEAEAALRRAIAAGVPDARIVVE